MLCVAQVAEGKGMSKFLGIYNKVGYIKMTLIILGCRFQMPYSSDTIWGFNLLYWKEPDVKSGPEPKFRFQSSCLYRVF